MSVEIRRGHVLDLLAAMPAESVHCVVTSPPYWGLRAYGTEPQLWGGDVACPHEWGATERHARRPDLLPASVSAAVSRIGVDARQGFGPADGGAFCRRCGAWRGELGQEPTLALHLENLVAVFRAVRRVLRRDGTLWLNYGDCYATAPNGRSAEKTKLARRDDRTFRDKPFSTVGGPLKPKDLAMVPNRLAIALQDDGWWVRSEIIWHKPNPMPSSVVDRPACAHEKVWLLSRSERYFYDAVAVRTAAKSPPSSWKDHDGWDVGPGAHGTVHRAGRSKGRTASEKQRALTPRHEGHVNHTGIDETPRGEAHLRNVWTIATAPFREAHFATFPPALVVDPIKAGTSERGCCGVCGAPFRRVVAGGETRGWRPTCHCVDASPTTRAVVLDPFGGAGTVGLVADRLGRDAILLELNPAYADIAERRIAEDGPLFAGASEVGLAQLGVDALEGGQGRFDRVDMAADIELGLLGAAQDGAGLDRGGGELGGDEAAGFEREHGGAPWGGCGDLTLTSPLPQAGEGPATCGATFAAEWVAR